MDIVETSGSSSQAAPPAAKQQKGGRRKKSENSELFNEILSACNQLSVAERTRLVKSLSGQLGFIAVGGQTLLEAQTKSDSKEVAKARGSSEPKAMVRQNPLKNTKFWVDKETAKAAMLKAREQNGGAQLAATHPAVTAYAEALKAYKGEQERLKLVPMPTSVVQGNTQATSAKQGRKRNASKSPQRDGVATRAVSFAKRLTGSGSRDGQ